jgi:hypothetical protein
MSDNEGLPQPLPQPPFPDADVPEDDLEGTQAWKDFVAGKTRMPPMVLPEEGVSIKEVKAVPVVNGRMVTPHQWDWRVVAAWIVFVCYGAILEMWTLFDGSDATPPLTWVVIRYVPEVIGIGFTSWLLYHFATEYWKAGDK